MEVESQESKAESRNPPRVLAFDFRLSTSLAIQFGQQRVCPAQVGNHYGSADYEGHVQCLFLFGAGNAQSPRLDDVVVDAVVTAQSGGDDQSHQLFVLRGNRAFEICVVVDVVDALDEVVVGGIDVVVEALACGDEFARDGALCGGIFFGEEEGGFSAVGWHERRVAETLFAARYSRIAKAKASTQTGVDLGFRRTLESMAAAIASRLIIDMAPKDMTQ